MRLDLATREPFSLLRQKLRSPSVRRWLKLSILLGFVWFAMSWRLPGGQPGPGPRSKALQVVEVKVSGQLLAEAEVDLDQLSLTLELIEVPFQQNFRWSELKPTPAGPGRWDFSASADFEFEGEVGPLVLRASTPGGWKAATPPRKLTDPSRVSLQLSR